MGFAGGYEDLKIAPDRYYVSVKGNGFTGETTLMGYFHRRAAEVCRGAGFSRYDFDTRSSESTYRQPSPYTATTTNGLGGRETTIKENPGSEVTKYAVKGYVQCLEPLPRASPPQVAQSQTRTPTGRDATAAPNALPAQPVAAEPSAPSASKFDMVMVDEGCTLVGTALGQTKTPTAA